MLTDKAFRYHPSYDTDLKRTFARVRRELKAEQQAGRAPAPAAPVRMTLVADLQPVPAAGPAARRQRQRQRGAA